MNEYWNTFQKDPLNANRNVRYDLRVPFIPGSCWKWKKETGRKKVFGSLCSRQEIEDLLFISDGNGKKNEQTIKTKRITMMVVSQLHWCSVAGSIHETVLSLDTIISYKKLKDPIKPATYLNPRPSDVRYCSWIQVKFLLITKLR